ncbi:NAD-dependent epimerase/dehydratase family protein [Cryptosporangium aurantiacum]|uniref:NAD dependent epimerase/dehydratase family protein n=1 Tax=Cryptosporangium aurantiacum TaxID=134849 RepID=A0A1M7RN33_9ACTN|nr:NAD-dependent epimerase/dehydratase family protein [Cryptosporangium aurantiacum]SHN47713.1 NAD dependent epimerase/dehydratase family protein [Cryptosporangium aurantiacum]
MHVLVLGATGYLGSAAVDRLVDAGHRVTAVSRSGGGAGPVPAADRVPTTAAELAGPGAAGRVTALPTDRVTADRVTADAADRAAAVAADPGTAAAADPGTAAAADPGTAVAADPGTADAADRAAAVAADPGTAAAADPGTAAAADRVTAAAADRVTAVATGRAAAAAADRVTAVAADLTDPGAIAALVTEDVDAVLHTAAPLGDADLPLVDALVDALAGSGRPLVWTSGIWVLGRTGDTPADESTPVAPIVITGPRAQVEERVLAAASRNIRTVVLRPGVVHGRGTGIPAMLVSWARELGHGRWVAPADAPATGGVAADGLASAADADGLAAADGLAGAASANGVAGADGAASADGARGVSGGRGTAAGPRWPLVHVDDLADLYLRALTGADAQGLLHAVAEPGVPAAELARAAAVGAGVEPTAVPWPEEKAAVELGAPFAEALALDQVITAERARALGWTPTRPSAVKDLATGSYAATPERTR